MKVFVVLATEQFQPYVDSVHRFKVNAMQRRIELITSGNAQNVEVVDKVLDEVPDETE